MKIQQLLALLALTTSVQAGPSTPLPPLPQAPTESSLWFRMAPYAWLTAISGDVAVGPLTAPVDIDISDTLNSLDMAYMGVFEVGKGNLSLGMDVVYAKTSQDFAAGNRIFESFRFEQKQWVLTPFLAYRVVDTGRYHMDVFGGTRITILETDLTGRFTGKGEITGSRDTSWADPIIGIRGQAELTDKLFFRYNGDIGGFGVSSDFTWQAFAGVGYHFTENVSAAIGYRGLGVDYQKGNFSMDTVSHGPVIGLDVRF